MRRIGCAVTGMTNAINTLTGSSINPTAINSVLEYFNNFPETTPDYDNLNSDILFDKVASDYGLSMVHVKENQDILGNLQARARTNEESYAILAKVKYKENEDSPHFVGVNGLSKIADKWYIEIAPTSGNDSVNDQRKESWVHVMSTGKTYVPISDIIELRIFNQ